MISNNFYLNRIENIRQHCSQYKYNFMMIFFQGICFYVSINRLGKCISDCGLQFKRQLESHDFSLMLCKLSCCPAPTYSKPHSTDYSLVYSFGSFPPEQKHVQIYFKKVKKRQIGKNNPPSTSQFSLYIYHPLPFSSFSAFSVKRCLCHIYSHMRLYLFPHNTHLDHSAPSHISATVLTMVT